MQNREQNNQKQKKNKSATPENSHKTGEKPETHNKTEDRQH